MTVTLNMLLEVLILLGTTYLYTLKKEEGFSVVIV